MGINFQRILLVSAFNYILKRVFKELDYNLIQKDLLKYSNIYSCKNCHRSFTSYFINIENKLCCPSCKCNRIDVKEPDIMEDDSYNGYGNNNKERNLT